MELHEENIVEFENDTCPSIIFNVRGDLYSVNSRYVKTIMQLPKYKAIPNSMPMISGVFMLRELTVPMLDMRAAFSLTTVERECAEFADMINKYKSQHISWVQELKKSVAAGEKFTLTTNPHQCDFGMWYDKYESAHNVVNSHMKQIDLPHQKLHKTAEQINEQLVNGNIEAANELLEKAEELYLPKIEKILDEVADVYKESYRQMVLVLSNEMSTIGLVVDEVTAVETLIDVGGEEAVRKFNNTEYIDGVKKSERMEELIIGLDDEKLLEITADFAGEMF